MSDLTKLEIAVLLIIAALLIVGRLDYDSAVVTAAHEAETYEKKSMLGLPLDCDAWVVQSGTPGEVPKGRCYARGAVSEAR